MRRIELLALARTLLKIDPGHVHGVVIGHSETEGFTTPEGHQVLLPRKDAVRSAVAGLFEAPPPGARPHDARCPSMQPHRARPIHDGGGTVERSDDA
jgi:hypothetical protein